MAQMKEEKRIPEKELSDAEIDSLSDAEFKTLVVRMLKDLIEYGKNIREEMKALLRGIKKNPQETNSEGKEAGIQVNELEYKEEVNIQPEQKEKTRIQKNEESLRRIWDISKRANIWIIEKPEGEEEEQELENLFEKNNERKLPWFG